MSIETHTILVTGSNTGIGHTVYLASRKEASGKEAQRKQKEHNLDAKFVQLDFTDKKSIQAAKETIEKEEGKLDMLRIPPGNDTQYHCHGLKHISIGFRPGGKLPMQAAKLLEEWVLLGPEDGKKIGEGSSGQIEVNFPGEV
ncbi:hypothetical protein BT96DRAFT_942080 [Gymnopus androsaceus JB14]|uniref:NAD(P)-binding protein n=1 Tax=Gymnopus androsaceus JB14 TaxID=1447944 RepID=A0A6A4HFF2_9AGAR|nr:hypothetical protein BT96DRAFT_942080 [Gymnopus androsaceus JB14]